MLQKLKQRWKVNNLNLVLIILTFALGGSLCGKAGAKLLQLSGIEKGALWVLIYIILVTLLWPACVLLISIPLGQFYFFRNYLKNVGERMKGKKTHTIHIAIFASGAGSNAQKIIHKFRHHPDIKIALIICNVKGAGVQKIANTEKIPFSLINKATFYNNDSCMEILKKHQVDFIVLAGFLWKIPAILLQYYPNKIINIHPALLPKYGGKGMYGSRVHEAVLAANEKESGISIHYVDEIYDHGKIIFQATCKVGPADTPELLAAKIHVLEHEHYPRIIEEVLLKQRSVKKQPA